MRRLLLCALLLGAFCSAALAPPRATASPYLLSGIQDDAWLSYGPGTLGERLDRLDGLGVDVVRVTIDWNAVEARRGAADWARYDAILNGLHAHGIAPLVTLWGTPGWANGGRGPNWAPTSGSTFASFARRAAQRYPFVSMWAIWNEPNQQRWLRPTSPRVYTQKLLDPAYASIHLVNRHAKVAGGVTAPRGSTSGVSPVDWIRGMAAAHARLDAYAHNPYPLLPHETPDSGGCDHCTTITMATLDRLLSNVRRSFGSHTRIWLTEYGYQTNPPDRLLGVSFATQARYLSDAALRAYRAPRVDVLIHYLVRDEPESSRWQSGLVSASDRLKPAYVAFRIPFAQVSRHGLRTVVWGQIRPGTRGTYRLQQYRAGAWRSVGATSTTGPRGIFTRTLRAAKGSRLRVWSPSAKATSILLRVS